MKNKIFLIAFIQFLFFTSSLFGQIEKGSWQIGVSGAPIFATNYSGLQGGLFSIDVDYALTKRLILELSPFYGYTNNEYSSVFVMPGMQPRIYSKSNFRSTGINFALKYYLINFSRLICYLWKKRQILLTKNCKYW